MALFAILLLFHYFCETIIIKTMAVYKRVLLKLSGESLMGSRQYGIDEERLADYARQIDKKDSKEIDDLSVDHSFSPDDNSFWVG